MDFTNGCGTSATIPALMYNSLLDNNKNNDK